MADEMDIRVLKIEKRYNRGKEEHWVLYGPADGITTCQTWDNVSRLMPPDEDSDIVEEINKRDPAGTKMFHIRAVWSQIAPAYEAWLKGEEPVREGTPLAAWPGVNAGQIRVLRKNAILTVEDAANMSDSTIARVMLPDVRAIKRLAAAYLSNKAAVATNETLDAMQAKLDAMQAKLDEAEKPKKKRGRPPKAA